jgi:glutamate dehydrogenase
MLDHRILECYANYIQQIFLQENPGYDAGATGTDPSHRLRQAWQLNPEMAACVVKMFRSKFLPESLGSSKSTDVPEIIHSSASFEMQKTALDAQDWGDFTPIVRAIHSTVRTNFYCDNAQALVIKIIHDTGIIEIFMDHPSFQGVILKGAMMARGGLRWSDREDFRSECWQLMQTQVLKNTIIVPSGAKGAFFLKETGADPLQAYKIFVEGLLDVSDNLEKGQVVPPKKVSCYDGHDFYNVVAADKGTASFSDHGNAVALDRGYWLGDAFASGGSNGYSHKKLAITSRGTWVSVRHHLDRLGYSGERPLRVVGVGDMAGDVFGNGMLEQSNMHVLAAFNHDSIFIDPTPNPDASYRERCRLFHLPQSKWWDYSDFSLGGAVYHRRQETIELSPQACALLGLKCALITPNALIREILSMPVDVLWLGGIGTFIQGESEDCIPDYANRDIRITGKQVRAKIVAEGANLGMTQAGRIEYALSGGSLNTDAIDNCAGVNCSDHEINIKILLDEVLRCGEISAQERGQILQSITEDVCALVLKENAWQNLTLTSACQGEKVQIMDQTLRFVKDCMERSPRGDAGLDALYQGLISGKSQGRGVTRPEMAMVLAYGKQHLKGVLSDRNLLNLGNEEGARYFPRIIQERFSGFLKGHLLFGAIKATVLANRFIDLLGPTKLVLLAKDWNVPFSEIVDALVQLDGEINGHRLAQKIEGDMADIPTALSLMGLYQSVVCTGLTQWASHRKDTGPVPKIKITGGSIDPDLWEKYQDALSVVTLTPMHI